MRIFEATPIAARLPTAWERVSPIWRAGDMALLEMLVARQLDALLLHVPAREWSRLLELLEALHAVQPAAALAIADRLDTLVQRLGVDGLRRWVLTGLRMFEAGDPSGPICAIMVALYITQDSFGTACNVSGDNAIGVIVETIYRRFICKSSAQ